MTSAILPSGGIKEYCMFNHPNSSTLNLKFNSENQIKSIEDYHTRYGAKKERFSIFDNTTAYYTLSGYAFRKVLELYDSNNVLIYKDDTEDPEVFNYNDVHNSLKEEFKN